MRHAMLKSRLRPVLVAAMLLGAGLSAGNWILAEPPPKEAEEPVRRFAGQARAHQIVQDAGIHEEYRRRYEVIRSGLIEVDSAGSFQQRREQRSVNSAASNNIWDGAPLVLFGSTGNQGATLITIDPATGAGTGIVPHGQFGPVTDIDCSPTSVMYGGTGGGSSNLITIDPTSVPAESLVGANGLGLSANIALEWVDSTLYGIVIFAGGGGSMSDLVTFDPNTGLATTVGPTGMGPIGGLAYDPNAGVMYGTESGGQSAGSFVTVDLNTGAATFLGLTGFADVAALDFDPSTGILYGGLGGSDPNAGSLITIDPSTGAGTLVGPTGFPVLSGVTFCGAPLGACCVVKTEICTDDQTEEECNAQGGEWHVGQSCVGILCPPPLSQPCGGANESFETGDFSGWLTQDLSMPFFALRVDGAGISPGFGFFSSAPTDGLFAALHGFDGNGPGTIAVAQDFDLPAGATALEFDYRGAWAVFGTQDRTFEVTLRPAGGGAPLEPPQLILTAETGTVVFDTGNLVGSIDVSAHAGSTIQVSFEWFVPEFFTGPAFFQMDNIRCLVPLEQQSLDIKPGFCPNSFNRNSHGVVPVSLLGSGTFDVADVDVSSIRMSRADGVGGSVAPHEGPPGPHTVIADTATPFGGELCDCHQLTGDTIDDLSMKFKTDELVPALELDSLPAGTLVELTVTGELLDGTPIVASDCVRLVPAGSPPGLLRLSSDIDRAWHDANPLDLGLDGGGFGDFERTYPLSTVVTLRARKRDGMPFVGWGVNGTLYPQHTIEIVIDSEMVEVHAVYRTGNRPRSR